jgi:two-component system chemotaxis response regulator CheB
LVIGASAGGGEVLLKILSRLPADYALPILLVQHLHPGDDGGFAEHLDRELELRVVTPSDKQKIESGHVYVAAANYHMLVERNGSIALSTEGRVNWSRPSIDVLFDSAAHAWGEKVIAILLSGASSDGTEGMRTVKALGGLTVVQDPVTAEHPVMPQSAINACVPDRVLPPESIGELLVEAGTRKMKKSEHGTRNSEH